MRGVVLRTLAVVGIGAAVLGVILYTASTYDARPPSVTRLALTQHVSADPTVALTTTSIEVTFSEPVDHATAEAAFHLTPSVRGAYTWSGSTLIFTPLARLPLRSRFSAEVAAGIKDRAGNVQPVAAQAFVFTTVGQPTVIASNPAPAAAPIPLDTPIQITFSSLMDTASVAGALELQPQAAARLVWSGERLSIVPTAPLQAGTTYQLWISTGARDVTGTRLDGPYSLTFATVASALSPHTIVPADGTQGIAATTPIAAIFDRPLDPGSISGDSLRLTPTVAGSLDAVAPQGAAGLGGTDLRILRFQPSGPLPANTTFQVTVSASLRAADGSRLSGPLSWSFTTGAPTTTLSNQIVFLTDRAGVANLWAMNSDGSNQRQLSAELSPITSYAVAPDGRSFVVGDGARLVEQRADGSGRRVLTDASVLEFDPAFSQDGATLAFARADPASGAGLGLWQRAAAGGDVRRLLGASQIATPGPSSTPGSAGSGPAPLLRAPRFAADGSAVAFVDSGGRVGILELASGTVTSVPFAAVSPPVWQPDGSVLFSGVGDPAIAPQVVISAGLAPLQAVSPLDAGSLSLTVAQRLAVGVGRLARGASAIVSLGLPGGAARPEVDSSGRVAYIVLDRDGLASGQLAGRAWVTLPAAAGPSFDLHRAGAADELNIGFTPEPGTLIAARLAADRVAATPSPSPSPSFTPGVTSSPGPTATRGPVPGSATGGVWLLSLANGAGQQLSPDGWQPRWLP